MRRRIIAATLGAATLGLAGATLLESRYGGRVAQELVYRTWWFALLLALLAVNVLCAALKKYPWKRHQAGFLITHAGLLVLVFGGLLTLLCGVEGQMVLIDTPDPALHRISGGPRSRLRQRVRRPDGALDRLDSVLLRRFPILKRWCRYVVIALRS